MVKFSFWHDLAVAFVQALSDMRYIIGATALWTALAVSL